MCNTEKCITHAARVIQFGIFLLSHVKEEGEIEMSCVLPLLLIFFTRVCVCAHYNAIVEVLYYYRTMTTTEELL